VSYLYACLGKTARHLQLLHPSAEELNDTRRDRVNGVLVNTFTWANTRIFKERGNRETLNSIGSAFNCIPMQLDAFYLNKIENGLQKNIDRNNKSGKVENKTLGKPYLLINGRISGLHVLH
jgi:hypothetical protein